MKTRVQLYKPENSSSAEIPMEFLRLREYEIKRAVDDMFLYGIKKIVLNYIDLGLVGWPDIQFQAMAATPPATLAKNRNFILRHNADRLIRFGILEIEIAPSPEELQKQQWEWQQLTTTPASEPAVKAPVALNIEVDPTPAQTATKPPEAQPPVQGE